MPKGESKSGAKLGSSKAVKRKLENDFKAEQVKPKKGKPTKCNLKAKNSSDTPVETRRQLRKGDNGIPKQNPVNNNAVPCTSKDDPIISNDRGRSSKDKTKSVAHGKSVSEQLADQFDNIDK